MSNPGKTKIEKACDILSNSGIKGCCEWLLDYTGGYLSDVPGVNIHPDTERAHNVYKSQVFSYDGKTYDLRYENFRSVTFPDGEESYLGDFILRIDSQIVLHTTFSQHEREYARSVNSIGICPYTIKKTVLGEWLEVIPRLVVKAQEIVAAKEAARKEEEARKLDDNIDLGKYE